MTQHTGQGQIIEAETITQDKNGNWVPAIPEKYHPSIIERTAHFFGVHQWTWTVLRDENGVVNITKDPAPDAKCVICNIKYGHPTNITSE